MRGFQVSVQSASVISTPQDSRECCCAHGKAQQGFQEGAHFLSLREGGAEEGGLLEGDSGGAPLVGGAPPPVWEENEPLRASCELMYRSLVGLYAMQSSRLKYEKYGQKSNLILPK